MAKHFTPELITDERCDRDGNPAVVEMLDDQDYVPDWELLCESCARDEGWNG